MEPTTYEFSSNIPLPITIPASGFAVAAAGKKIGSPPEAVLLLVEVGTITVAYRLGTLQDVNETIEVLTRCRDAVWPPIGRVPIG